MDLKNKIRVINGFPKEEISFKDITTLIADKDGLKESVDRLAKHLEDKNVDLILSPEARGFLFGMPVAYALGAGFIPVRKPGKLPAETIDQEYDLEYGTDKLEIHKDAIKKGQRVAIVDDLLATGGTAEAVAKLAKKCGVEVVSIDFVVELTDLKAKEKLLKDYDVFSLVKYNI
ncbi:adenine phosphoribosyltransferase [Clostridium sp. BJN0001]|uniref:adenine phosphoribosyltransferase n=1 Tax=Clostridium sp. BJN0001 TaxID=2930219 RepID=UPI001FD30AC7|nr:adenine phosphoribosyltransferase [Clostridium sp. BJN0001]